MNPGYTHGWLDCWHCYNENKDPFVYNNWELHNDPGYAGSSSPRILVLGFSKGATQMRDRQTGRLRQSAFCRHAPPPPTGAGGAEPDAQGSQHRRDADS